VSDAVATPVKSDSGSGLTSAVQLAISHFDSDKPADAERICRKILQAIPDEPHALQLLGILRSQAGDLEEGIALLERCVKLIPGSAEAHTNFATALKAAGRFDEAIAAARKAVNLNPEFAPASHLLGALYYTKNDIDDAIIAFQRALKLNGGSFETMNDLGVCLMMRGQNDRAIELYRESVRLFPSFAEAHNNLGNALKEKNRREEAIESYKTALIHNPSFAPAHNNLGVALLETGKIDASLESFTAALRINPDYAEALSNLGNLLIERGELDEAMRYLTRAIQLKADFAAAHNNLGTALKSRGQIEGAIAAYQTAITLEPKNSAFYSNWVYARLFHCDTNSIAELPRFSDWNERPRLAFANPPIPNRPLRIGYISPDFRDHVIGRNILPLLRNHDHRQFQIYGYARLNRHDAATECFRACCNQWRDITGQGDDRIVQLISDDGIDILIDLAMHLSDNVLCIMAKKPAPVQITFAGYPGSTGLPTIDFRITDPYLDSPGETDADHTEQSIVLPETFWCYDPAAIPGNTAEIPPVSALPALSSGCITFGCLCDFCKVNPKTIALWARVLKEVADSRMLLLAPPGQSRQRVLEHFAVSGIAPARLIFTARQPRLDYLRTYHLIDICLDTLPYNGHTTSLDALWMGTPVVNRVGSTAVGRAGLSQMSNLGLRELIAHSDGEFVNIAAKLAADFPRLQGLRQTLRQRMRHSPLMDAGRFARNIESAYRDAWRSWCRRQVPPRDSVEVQTFTSDLGKPRKVLA
jgi:protein O-GlcNAc transferase